MSQIYSCVVLYFGKGPQPAVGELVAIRFTGAYNGKVFDDVYKTPEPLYFRVGTNSLLKVRYQDAQTMPNETFR